MWICVLYTKRNRDKGEEKTKQGVELVAMKSHEITKENCFENVQMTLEEGEEPHGDIDSPEKVQSQSSDQGNISDTEEIPVDAGM
jgi:hypothetical protein